MSFIADLTKPIFNSESHNLSSPLHFLTFLKNYLGGKEDRARVRGRDRNVYQQMRDQSMKPRTQSRSCTQVAEI